MRPKRFFNEAPRANAHGIFSTLLGGAKSAEAEISSHSSASLHSRFSAKVDKYRAVIVVTTLLLSVIAATYFASIFIRGYRPDFETRTLLPTGILVANSFPEGASVLISDKLVTATNDTINLTPKDYQIKIEKEGYFPWQKTIKIEKEVVKQTNAFLFKSVPDLKPLTLAGANNALLSPDGTKIVYVVKEPKQLSANGVWVLDLTATPLNFLRPSTKQIIQAQADLDWLKAKFLWSPDSKKILAYFTSEPEISTGINKTKLSKNQPPITVFSDSWFKSIKSSYLLSVDQSITSDQLKDAGWQLPLITEGWQNEIKQLVDLKIKKLPPDLQKIATASAEIISWSNDEEKIVYLATQSATIPEKLLPHPPARSDQPESRKIEPGKIYVYDLKEDTNFLIADKEKITTIAGQNYNFNRPLILWLATNRHLLLIEDGKAQVVEYDGQNKEAVFSEKFENGYLYPWPDGTKIVILTSLHPEPPLNLYAVSIR